MKKIALIIVLTLSFLIDSTGFDLALAQDPAPASQDSNNLKEARKNLREAKKEMKKARRAKQKHRRAKKKARHQARKEEKNQQPAPDTLPASPAESENP